MADCCTNTACEIDKLRARQRSTLLAVLWINLALFGIESSAGLLAASTALQADALDMLGDAMVYGFSLYVVARGDLWKARAALFKGAVMAAFGLLVLGQAIHKVIAPELPHYPTMGGIALLALAANAVCLWLLWSHRADDINMRSVWLCSRNDIVANVSVIGAGVAVWALHSQWPDIVVGVAIAALFLRSAASVLGEARAEHRRHTRAAQPTSTVTPLKTSH